MRCLAVHPGPLMYTRIFLRLEPLGLELVAEAARQAGHEAKLIDLQVEPAEACLRLVEDWRPDAVAISCNYLANVPEVVELARAIKAHRPGCFVFVGGHSASFVAGDLLAHAEGAIDCVLRGEGEAAIPALLEAIPDGPEAVARVPGAITAEGEGPPPRFVESLDDLRPARDLVRHRRKYFIGMLDPVASIEFSRGCPWDCSFCSAWTFYGRSYRTVSPEVAAEELARIREPGVFIVDDVAFIQARHGLAIGEAAARRGIRKQYYLETRGDVLLRNKEVFRLWRDLGLTYMFLGLEAIDEAGLKRFRKRATLGQNFEALDFARSLGIQVAINIIADPDWDEERFRVVREWCLEIPEIVNISVTTPYPGTEIWNTDARRLTTRDYRLFDIQHAVLPTRLPLERFYAELVRTQQVMNRKHLRWRALRDFAPVIARLALRGQTNFFGMLWKFNKVYDPALLLADHRRPPTCEMTLPPPARASVEPRSLYVHDSGGRRSRALDSATERFVDETRLGAAE
ncbi:magnesium-protoporphyrin IX monomethyl ester (oxidative) cyclase [Tistlia consotensis]|uniref:Magnesium-protoporphyrin IX monomethyl ester (Oxidative) cyclase n=1 Tax=Tistlia consotensis USBA 355 TaxID=560819 RepID=A0A1Y6CMF3_9PROT|nr:hopanoid C-3 methylase HpnR [Tistlia consotensis]SMF77667.1 magnesium-protoporphyrin IX monomethyl ester (oxidative) cyclase [Tistlia consotensis USBA 355]SNS20858.1 magnesium-protoporphyrin IX monomethyl ester (oxidative) cyclase [Tistlia consotensis]